jgi:hypothetical protein
MKWSRIDIYNLPDQECLCRSAEGYLLIGWMTYDIKENWVTCKGDGINIVNITHYITSEGLDELPE